MHTDRKYRVALLLALTIPAGRIVGFAAAFAFLFALMEGPKDRSVRSVPVTAAALLALAAAILPSVTLEDKLLLLLFIVYAAVTVLPFGLRERKVWLWAHLLFCAALCGLYLFRITLSAPGMEHITVAELARYSRVGTAAYWVDRARCLLNLCVLLPLLKKTST